LEAGVGVSIFSLVWFLSKKITKIKFLKSEKFKLEPVAVQFGFFNIKTSKPVFFCIFGLSDGLFDRLVINVNKLNII
jgi:hypothetical protein